MPAQAPYLANVPPFHQAVGETYQAFAGGAADAQPAILNINTPDVDPRIHGPELPVTADIVRTGERHDD